MDTHVTSAHALAITRRMPAPPDAVFAAWTQEDQLRRWYAPRGMEVAECRVEPRRGGAFSVTMRDAAGALHPHPMTIDAIDAPRRLMLRVGEGMSCDLAGAAGTVLFHPEGDGTRLDVSWSHPTEEMRARHAAMGFATGWSDLMDTLTAHLLRPDEASPMSPPPAPEHGWLHRLVGTWSYEMEGAGPDGVMLRGEGREVVRPLGGFWVIGEAEGSMPGCGLGRWVVTLGWDAQAARFRGSWVGSMMGHMFVYDGALSDDRRVLTLQNEGPSFTGQGTARYRDIVMLESDDLRLLHSEVEGEDGRWTRFVSSRFRRIG